MPRTTSLLVQGILLDDYSISEPSLTPFIDSATALVSRVVACAAAKGKSLTDAEAELIERWLAAHYYSVSDRPYKKKRTAESSGEFQGETKMGLESSHYGQTAMELDYSGCLASLSKRHSARVVWLGKPPSEQISIDNRD